MYEDSFPVPRLCNLKYVSPYFIQNRMQVADPLQSLPCFVKLIPGIFGRLVNFKISKRFLCRRPVFPDYLSI